MPPDTDQARSPAPGACRAPTLPPIRAGATFARDALRDGEIDAQELTAIRQAATAATLATEQLVASATAAAEATAARRVRPIKGRAA